MTDEPKKFARQSGMPMRPDLMDNVYYLYVGDQLLTVTGPTANYVRMQADAINAAFEVEVERRLDEITRRAAV